ncbi:hypothetical protein GALMADRAFT_245429 [Galerina marginata CBS 339.88]|uniref:RING-CH-type domain-containing protein n=1 Tax=Galerina marginata (strain CBS 339.88) TaxID=685588 RepID=A0A067TEJ2_GALM3|nr:hypothetical protein GALMADRAFT_245429 [Galerina marginata CBS 339.88]
MPATPRIPTVNDLRVKLCYICREEELAGAPQDDPPRAWTHPCTCTLIAHEQCLLKWIQSSQGNASRAPNALKCPQCATQYEIESDDPLILRGLALGNKFLQKLGRYCTVMGVAAGIGVVGTSIYVSLTAYGAWAMQQFIGKELFDVIFTDDPVNWPWSAYINLPLLPIGLILSRFQTSSGSMVIPLLLTWPPSLPAGAHNGGLYEYWMKPENASRLSRMSVLPTQYWPPPPVLFGLIGLPIVRAIYRKCYAHLYFKLLGTPLPAPRRVPRGGLQFNEGPFVIRIRANMDDGDQQNDQQQQDQQDQQQPIEGDIPAGEGEDPAANPNPNAAAVEAAEALIEINASSLGRRIGGALVIPAISSMMGNFLFRLSRHSGLLRSVLGVQGHKIGRYNYTLPPWSRFTMTTTDKPWSQLSLYQQAKVGFRLFMTAFLGGSRTWVDSDPVWWRNCVGFGLFVAVKDCIQLLHLWLAKRELESRKVKDRDFKGVDVRELDLLPSFLQAS